MNALRVYFHRQSIHHAVWEFSPLCICLFTSTHETHSRAVVELSCDVTQLGLQTVDLAHLLIVSRLPITSLRIQLLRHPLHLSTLDRRGLVPLRSVTLLHRRHRLCRITPNHTSAHHQSTAVHYLHCDLSMSPAASQHAGPPRTCPYPLCDSAPPTTSPVHHQSTQHSSLKHTHHAQPFHGLFSKTTWVSRYQNGKTSLDLNEERDDGVLGCSANNLHLASDR